MPSISTIIIIAAILSILYLIQNQRMKNKTKACVKEAHRLHEKLEQLSDPSHLFTDEEVVQIKNEYARWLKKVNQLYRSAFLSNGYIDSQGLKDYMNESNIIDHKQYINNQAHNKMT